MKHLKLLFFLLVPISVLSQIGGEGEVYLTGERIDAIFNGGGIEKFTEYLNKEFDYSKVTKSGRLEATFTIDEQGLVTKIRITEVLDVESAKEFIRVLKKCPKWEPAKRGGKPISIEIKYPMVFKEKAKKPIHVVSNDAKNDTKDNSSNVEDNSIHKTAGIEFKPDFPGGIKEFYNYIGQNYKVPDVKGLKGKIFVSFIIEKDGSVTDIKVLRDIGYGTGEEAVRVLKKCPKWIPGEQAGKKVRVLYSLPIAITSK
jgi:hypothetical protein